MPHDWRLYAVILLNYLAIGSLGPLVPELQRDLRLSTTEVGAMVAAYGVARLLVSLPVGQLAGRRRHRPLLAVGTVFVTLAHAGSAAAAGSAVLAGCQALAGVGSAFTHVTSLAVLAMRARRHESGRIMGAYYTATFGGLAMAAPIAGYLAATVGWRQAFLGAALMAAAALGVLAGRPGPATPVPATAPRTRRESLAPTGWRPAGVAIAPLLRAGQWPVYLLHFTALFLFAGVRTTLLPVFAATVWQLPVSVIGAVLGIGSLATLGSLFLAGVLADRLGKLRLVACGLALSAAGVLLLMVVRGVTGLAVALLVLDLGQGLLAGNAAALLADRVPGPSVGTAMGVMRVMADVGFLTGPVVLGFLIDRLGYGAAIWAGAAVPLGSLALLARLGPALPPPALPEQPAPPASH